MSKKCSQEDAMAVIAVVVLVLVLTDMVCDDIN